MPADQRGNAVRIALIPRVISRLFRGLRAVAGSCERCADAAREQYVSVRSTQIRDSPLAQSASRARAEREHRARRTRTAMLGVA